MSSCKLLLPFRTIGVRSPVFFAQKAYRIEAGQPLKLRQGDRIWFAAPSCENTRTQRSEKELELLYTLFLRDQNGETREPVQGIARACTEVREGTKYVSNSALPTQPPGRNKECRMLESSSQITTHLRRNRLTAYSTKCYGGKENQATLLYQ